MNLLRLDDSLAVADDVRLLVVAAAGMPLTEAVSDLAGMLSGKDVQWALCGGLAVGVHARPRGTNDVDIMVPDEMTVDRIVMLLNEKFRRTRDHAVTHRRSGVEVEILSPEFLNVDSAISKAVISSASHSQVGKSSIPVVTRAGLVASKLGRSSRQDLADIEAVIRMGGPVDLSGYPLEDEQMDVYRGILKDVSPDKP